MQVHARLLMISYRNTPLSGRHNLRPNFFYPLSKNLCTNQHPLYFHEFIRPIKPQLTITNRYSLAQERAIDINEYIGSVFSQTKLSTTVGESTQHSTPQ